MGGQLHRNTQLHGQTYDLFRNLSFLLPFAFGIEVLKGADDFFVVRGTDF
jgi:hypothetical protein